MRKRSKLLCLLALIIALTFGSTLSVSAATKTVKVEKRQGSYYVSAKYFNGLCCPINESIIIIRKCKHFTSSSLARNDRCEHFTLSDLWRCAHEKQKNTCRRTIPSHHGMPSKWIDRSSMVCGTRHQTGNFLQLGKKAASERLCGFASVNRTQLSCTGKPGSCQSGFS